METEFSNLCTMGNLEGVQEYLRLNPHTNHVYIVDAFIVSCYYGHLHVAQWLFQAKPNINISVNDEFAFRMACERCERGLLDVAKWLLQVSKEKGQDINISVYNEFAFRMACRNGNLKVAQWLLEVKPDINISAENEFAFRRACVFAHLDLAKWLLQIKPTINISANNEEAFCYACKQGHLNIAQWLQSLKPYLYVIEYDENGKMKGYKIRSKEEANWQRRKYLVWLASNDCPEENKSNLLYKLPSDVSRLVIGFV